MNQQAVAPLRSGCKVGQPPTHASLFALSCPFAIFFLHASILNVETKQLPPINQNLGWLKVIAMVVRFSLLDIPAFGIKRNLGSLEHPDAVIPIKNTETVVAAQGLQVSPFEKKDAALRDLGMPGGQVIKD
jgi:hypothetical protein